MLDQPHTAGAGPARRPGAGRGLSLGLAVVALVGCILAVLYAMAPSGKEAATPCPAAAATLARLDPLIHGEVAAFGLDDPARLAPDLVFEGPDGKPLTLASLRGRTVLLNLWATWCVPCRKEMPSLDALQGKLGSQAFEVVALNVDTARLDRPKAFLSEAKIANLAFYADPDGGVLQVLKARGGLLGLPTTLLIDRNGCELGRIAGPAEWASPEAEHLVEAAKG